MVRYRDIAETLEATLAVGDPPQPRTLPSEVELCARFGASRTTIRAALQRLHERGLIERRQGSGTFYRPPHITKRLGSLIDFHTEALAGGRVPATRVLGLATRPATAAEAALFGAEAVVDGVGDLLRLRTLDGQPAVLQRSRIARRVLGAVPAATFEDTSLYRYLLDARGVAVVDLEETLEPANVAGEDAAHLDLAPGTAVFRSHRVARDAGGRAIEASENLVRGDLYRFTVRNHLRDGLM